MLRHRLKEKKIALARLVKTPNVTGTRTFRHVCTRTGVVTEAIARSGASVYTQSTQDELCANTRQMSLRKQLRAGHVRWLHCSTPLTLLVWDVCKFVARSCQT